MPIGGGMALCAVVAEAPLMRVLMTGGTARRKAEPCVIQIFGAEQRARRRGDMLRRVASAALYSCVLAIKRVAGLCVIEILRVPVDESEVFAVVIRVAFYAGSALRA